MIRTPEQIQADIESHEAALEDLRVALKEAQSLPKPGDVYVDQHGVAYVATTDGRSGGVVLWNIGGTKWSRTAAYHGNYCYWTTHLGKTLTRVTAGNDRRPFNILEENAPDGFKK